MRTYGRRVAPDANDRTRMEQAFSWLRGTAKPDNGPRSDARHSFASPTAQRSASGSASPTSPRTASRPRPGLRFGLLQTAGWLAIAALLVLAAAAGLQRERRTPIATVRLTGNALLPPSATDPLIRSIQGLHPDSLPAHPALAELRRHPYVRHLRYSLLSAGELEIHVQERTPALWLARGSKRMLLTADGRIVPPPADDGLSLPTLSGLPLRRDLDPAAALPFGDALADDDPKLQAALHELMTAIQSDEFAFLSLRELSWDSRLGLVARTPNASARIVLGYEEFQSRFDKWHRFYRDVILIKGMDPFLSIDLRFEGNVITKETPHES